MIKNMTKSKAIVILIVMMLALAGITYVDIAGVDASGRGSASDIKLGLDLAGGVSITYQVVGEEEPSSTDMADTISKLQQRVWNYSTEAVVYQEGTDRINIEIPGVSDANAILQDCVGIGNAGDLNVDTIRTLLIHHCLGTVIPHTLLQFGDGIRHIR